jgi:hypothetical protein
MSLKLSDGLDTHCQSSFHQDPEENWWGIAGPAGVNVSAPGGTRPELCDKVHTTEIGFLLYDRLRTAPPFRYAAVGWETDDFRYFSDLEPGDALIAGVVISDEIWQYLGRPSNLEPFSPGYLWTPWEGEKE